MNTRTLKTYLLLAIIGLVSCEVVWAQAWAINDGKEDGVYDSLTTTSENPKVKSLTDKQFSKYAAELCEKFGIDGPKEITSLARRDSLIRNLINWRKEKSKQLGDPEAFKDDAEKLKLETLVTTITKVLQNFPELKIAGKSAIKNESVKSVELRSESRPIVKIDAFSHPRLPLNPTPLSNVCDPISTTREQIEKQHGIYYTQPDKVNEKR